MFAFFSCPYVGRPTTGTKSFDSASDSILSDGPTGYMTNRSSCLIRYTLFEKESLNFGYHSVSKPSMFGTVWDVILPGSKCICSSLKLKVSILGIRQNFWLGIESSADEDK